eukprot:tig00020927_g15945.t1
MEARRPRFDVETERQWSGPHAEGSLLPAKEYSSEELQQLSRRTLAHYDGLANEFWESTKDHDVSQNRDALLRAIAAGGREAPFDILGPSPPPPPRAPTRLQDDRGHTVFGLEGSREFVRMAADIAPKAKVLHQDMLSALLPESTFDGIFANASLFHVPRRELPRVLRELRASLKPGGVLFMSNPRGDGFEGPRPEDERYGNFMDYEEWRAYALDAGLEEVEHYYRPPGVQRILQRWIAIVLRRPS